MYGYPGSPYARLLRAVGCQYGDLARLVTHEGLEGALHALYRQGVYLTVEELKGTKPVVRGTTRFTVRRRQLRNPRWRVSVARPDGETWKAVRTPYHRAMFHEQSVNVRTILAARGHPAWRLVFWVLLARSVAIPDGALIELLESEPPRRLRGAPHHYQLVEDEAEDGAVVVRLLVDPAVGPLDPASVAEAFLSALRRTGPDGEQLAREGGWLRIERRAPLMTPSGKIHHVVRPMEDR